GLVAPPNARTCELSIAARDQSIRSASFSFANNSSCSWCQTPASCHSRNRRQQVIPEPQPISCGRYLPRDPRLQHEQDPRQHLPIVDPPPPGNRCRLRTFGINGSIQSHSSSETNRLAIVAI